MRIKTGDFEISDVTKKRFKVKYFDSKDFKGNVGLLTIVESNKIPKREGKIAEHASSGCNWLEFYPEDSNVSMVVTYDKNNEVFGWYFDMIDGVGITNSGNPYIVDLYLDVLLYPDGEIELLDEDELKEALDNRDITKEQFDRAYRTAHNLMKRIDGKVKQIDEFSRKYFNLMLD